MAVFSAGNLGMESVSSAGLSNMGGPTGDRQARIDNAGGQWDRPGGFERDPANLWMTPRAGQQDEQKLANSIMEADKQARDSAGQSLHAGENINASDFIDPDKIHGAYSGHTKINNGKGVLDSIFGSKNHQATLHGGQSLFQTQQQQAAAASLNSGGGARGR